MLFYFIGTFLFYYFFGKLHDWAYNNCWRIGWH